MHPSNTISRISDLVTVVSRVTNDADICLFVKSLPSYISKVIFLNTSKQINIKEEDVVINHETILIENSATLNCNILRDIYLNTNTQWLLFLDSNESIDARFNDFFTIPKIDTQKSVSLNIAISDNKGNYYIDNLKNHDLLRKPDCLISKNAQKTNLLIQKTVYGNHLSM